MHQRAFAAVAKKPLKNGLIAWVGLPKKSQSNQFSSKVVESRVAPIFSSSSRVMSSSFFCFRKAYSSLGTAKLLVANKPPFSCSQQRQLTAYYYIHHCILQKRRKKSPCPIYVYSLWPLSAQDLNWGNPPCAQQLRSEQQQICIPYAKGLFFSSSLVVHKTRRRSPFSSSLLVSTNFQPCCLAVVVAPIAITKKSLREELWERSTFAKVVQEVQQLESLHCHCAAQRQL